MPGMGAAWLLQSLAEEDCCFLPVSQMVGLHFAFDYCIPFESHWILI